MFETLVESGQRRRTPAGAGMVSLAVHAGLVALGVAATAGTIVAHHPRQPIDLGMVYQDLPPADADVADDDAGSSDAAAAIVLRPLPLVLDNMPDPVWSISTVHDPRVDPIGALRGRIDSLARTAGINGGTRQGREMAGALLAGEVDEPVRVLTAVTPKYPLVQESAGVPGRVVVEFIVGTTGEIEAGSLRIVEASDSAFASPSRDAVQRATYAPATVRGTPVRQLVRQTLVYRSRGT